MKTKSKQTLAKGSEFLPEDGYAQAQILQWMFFEQYSHEPYIAVARFIYRFLSEKDERRGELPRLHERGYQALDVMEQHLATSDFFVSSGYSIADIALFAYTKPATEGGFDLSNYKAINAWLQRIENQPGYLPMV